MNKRIQLYPANGSHQGGWMVQSDFDGTISVLDVTEDPAALEQVKSLGYLQAPVVITDEDHWSGFRPDKIDELASRLA